MLSYQHGYHAGCFADVVKHFTQTCLINYMTKKDKPLFYLETHAGRGLYDLNDLQSRKTREYEQGIALVWQERKRAPTCFSPYFHILDELNEDGQLRYYPGSPYIAIHLLRPKDRLTLSELHPREFEHLQQLHRAGRRVFFSNEDGMARLTADLPPLERRGLIFIDPSFEVKTEYQQIPKILGGALKRFAEGVFCLWYPIVNPALHQQLTKGLQTVAPGNNLNLEFINADAQGGMQGCGLWIANPPYVLKAELEHGLSFLSSVLSPRGGCRWRLWS